MISHAESVEYARILASEERAAKSKDYRKFRGWQLRAFGITLEEYEAMLEAQDGLCAVCEKACSTGKALAVDHDHVTGKVRGLLCSRCNRALGGLRDDPTLMRRAAEYIEKAQ